MVSENRTINIPITKHFRIFDTERFPKFPNRSWRELSVRMACSRTINHSKITVSTILKHIAHLTEWNAGEGDKPFVRHHLIILKPLAKPKSVDIREESSVLICRAN